MNKSLLFKNAHKITKKIVNKYGVNYNTQLGISLKIVYIQFKQYIKNEITKHQRNILLTLNKMINTGNEYLFDKVFTLYKKKCDTKNLQQKWYNMKSFDAYLRNAQYDFYTIYDEDYHGGYRFTDCLENISAYLKTK